MNRRRAVALDWRWWSRALGFLTLALALMFTAGAWFRIGINSHGCMDETVFLVGRWSPIMERGKVYTFSSLGAQPFRDGTVMVKRLVGLPGDEVRIGNGQAFVNGVLIGDLRYAKSAPHMRPEVDERIPEGKYFFAGTTEVSYDSRYWGYVDVSQIGGRAWPLW